MSVEKFLLGQGIRTYSYPVITEITTEIEVPFGDSISTELGWIYGISAEIDGVTPKNKTILLPSLVQLSGLYMNLQYGQTWYINDFRMSNLVYNTPLAGLVIPSLARYYPVNIPFTTDLKQSIIRNPLGLSGFSTMVTFHYIPRKTYLELVKSGKLKENDLGIV